MGALKPIGIFDSGLGGLSVLREIRQLLPGEALIYVADQGRLPYGPRPVEEIRQFSEQISHFLLAHQAQLIVVACNTASAAALAYLRHRFPHVPFVGMEPAVKPAAQQSQSQIVGVLATQATCQSEVFASIIDRFAKGVTVLPQACPELVTQVEAGAFDTPTTSQLLQSYLTPLLEAGIDSLVLGCTHFSFLTPAITRIVGPQVRIIDPAPAVARQVSRVLQHPRAAQPGASITAFTTGKTDPSALASQMVTEPIQFQPLAMTTLQSYNFL